LLRTPIDNKITDNNYRKNKSIMKNKMGRPPALAADMALFLDFDGTLVDIADRPDLVNVPAALQQQLVQVSALLDGALAVISGRRIADIDALFGGGVAATAGLHGWERRRTDGEVVYAGPIPDQFAAAWKVCADFAAGMDGVIFEDKGAALALHYRLRPEAAEACWCAARNAAEACPELDVRSGHCVVELRPRAADKGKAVTAYLREPPFVGRRPVFIGDDTTDEDAFAAVVRDGGYGVLVGPQRATAANAHLPTVDDVHRWLMRVSADA